MKENSFNQLRLGLNIRLRRKLLRLTQAELAHRVGCGVQTISDIERGKRPISVNMLFSLSRAMGWPVAEILRGVE